MHNTKHIFSIRHKHKILYIVRHQNIGVIHKSYSLDNAKRFLHTQIISLFNNELSDTFLSSDLCETKQEYLSSETGIKTAQEIWDDARSFYTLYERTSIDFGDGEIDIEDLLLENELDPNYNDYLQ